MSLCALYCRPISNAEVDFVSDDDELWKLPVAKPKKNASKLW
jgi:hypothetical protein